MNNFIIKYFTSRMLLIFLFVIINIINTSAQTPPQAISYQAAARDNAGSLLTNHLISLRFSIHDSSPAGVVIYKETHIVTTNSLGLFTVNIGQGTVVTGTFIGINWAVNAKFMQVELDDTGGSSYINMGTQQMLSVPYALYAGSSGSTSGVSGTSNFVSKFMGTNTLGNSIIFDNGTNVGIGNSSPLSKFSVGSSSQFQVNSIGAIGAATGINSSGTIQFSGLSTNGILRTTGGTGTLSSSGGAINLAAEVTGMLPVANGGTGSSSQNFVDLTSNQTVGGLKTFTGNLKTTSLAGASNRMVQTDANGLLIPLAPGTASEVLLGTGAWGNVPTNAAWSLTGNAGTVPGTNFIGSTDLQPLVFKVNNSRAGLIDFADANTSIGFQAANVTTGIGNSAFGTQALLLNSGGEHNTSVGYNSLYNNLSGYYNTAMGSQALLTNFSGMNNTAIGYQADVTTNNLTNATAIGSKAKVSASNNLILGGTGIDAVNIGTGVTSATMAKLQVQGMVGHTVAYLCGSANSQGISLVSDWPGIFFNCYSNSGTRAMAASGFPSFINTDQASGGMTFQTTNAANTVSGNLVTVPERMRITGDGNVGIGTSAPKDKLSIRGGALGFHHPTSPSDVSYVGIDFDDVTDAMRFRSNIGTPALNITNMTIKRLTGNVGIGSTAPTEKLTVQSSDNNSTTNVTSVMSNNLTEGIGFGYNEIRKIGTNANDNLLMNAKGSGNVMLLTSGTGKVGIGSLSPTSKLTVLSSDNLTTTNITSVLANSQAEGIGIGYNEIRKIGSNPNDNLLLNAKGTGDLLLSTYGTGKVGIGNLTPAEKLDVTGNVKASGDVTVQSDKGIIRNTTGTQLKIVATNVQVGNGLNWGVDDVYSLPISWSESFSSAPVAFVGNVTTGTGSYLVDITITSSTATGATLFFHNNSMMIFPVNFNVNIIAIGPQ